MPYSPADRILSISFKRDLEEHADAMFDVGRRLATETKTVSPWIGFGMAIGLGALIGVTMELHRRFVLPAILGVEDAPPLGTAILQFLPVLLIAIGVYVFLHLRTIRSQRRAVLSQLRPDLTIDIEIFRQGVTASTGAFNMDVNWSFVSDVYVDGARIEIACESLSIYIPERAFPSRASFTEAFKQIRGVWQDATRRDRDRKMIEAGVD